MTLKLIVTLALVAVSSAAQVYQTSPKAGQPTYTKQEESYAAHPKYQFSYAVNDEHTGDVKSQVESRDGDVVHGEYSLVDADGFKRVVQYSADHEHGFNAVVQREPLHYGNKAAAPATIVKAAPVVKSAPITYASAPTQFKSTQATYAAAPTQASYFSQSNVKSAPGPSHTSYINQPLVKKSSVTYAAAPVQQAYKSQPFPKSTSVIHSVKQPSYARQPLAKSGAYIRHSSYY